VVDEGRLSHGMESLHQRRFAEAGTVTVSSRVCWAWWHCGDVSLTPLRHGTGTVSLTASPAPHPLPSGPGQRVRHVRPGHAPRAPALATRPSAHHVRHVARMSQEPAECAGTGRDETGRGGITTPSHSGRLLITGSLAGSVGLGWWTVSPQQETVQRSCPYCPRGMPREPLGS
jgi:hypothetical protein